MNGNSGHWCLMSERKKDGVHWTETRQINMDTNKNAERDRVREGGGRERSIRII